MGNFAQKINKKWMPIIIAIGIIFVIYFYGVIYYNWNFLKGTTINGINVSKLKISEIEDHIKNYQISIKQINLDNSIFEEKISGSKIDLKISDLNKLKELIKKQNNFLWFIKSSNEYNDLDIINLDEKKLEDQIMKLKGFDESFAQEPVDAHISEYSKKKGYKIVKEVYGNKLSEEVTKQVIKDSILSMDNEVDLKEKGCYLKPSITSKDKKLSNLLDELNKYVSIKINYKFGDKNETLDGSIINNWLSVEDNAVKFNQDKVVEFIASLRKKYDTIFTTRNFHTSYGQQVKIDSGDYGWWINSEKESAELIEMIKRGESGDRTPVYYQTAASYEGNDYGNTYVEINLTAQHLFFYKDGKLVLESDFVSGNTSNGNGTPSGIYSVTYTEADSVLSGEDYKTPVSFWMPFNNNIGLHDAIWRDNFGGNIYSSGGSHGCINMPYSKAKELFSYLEKGMPVICYELPGTESSTTTVQTAAQRAQAIIDAIDRIGTVNSNSKKKVERARELYEQVGSDVRAYVSNYNVLLDAEKELRN